MTLRWHDAARTETDAAAAFYNDKQPGLAQRFLDEIEERSTAYNVTHGLMALWRERYASAEWCIFLTA